MVLLLSTPSPSSPHSPLSHTHIHNNIDESATKENDNVIRQEKRKKERKNLGKISHLGIWMRLWKQKMSSEKTKNKKRKHSNKKKKKNKLLACSCSGSFYSLSPPYLLSPRGSSVGRISSPHRATTSRCRFRSWEQARPSRRVA